ncbi:hypothetical protein CDD81_5362 [Ophiocordyceps australis]|uniref:Uncharacterized protein n=1 Tax=Ophiocordyceps australis TaxID=1399860 RepID=A0A2C5YAD3_9HYPO|nr:hypothetical protein CDD81_5362 [Ophiocordyceps australis]
MYHPPSYSGYQPPCYCPPLRAVTTMTFERTVTAPASVSTVFFSQICEGPQALDAADPNTVTITSFIHAVHTQADHSTTTVTVTLSPQSTVTVHAPVAPAKPVVLDPAKPVAVDSAKPVSVDPAKPLAVDPARTKAAQTAAAQPIKPQSLQPADPPVSPPTKPQASQPAQPPISQPAPVKPAVLQSAEPHVSQPTPIKPAVLQPPKPLSSQSIQPAPPHPTQPKPVKFQPQPVPIFRNTSFITQTLSLRPSTSKPLLDKAFTSQPCASAGNFTRLATVYNTVYKTADPPPYPVRAIETRAAMVDNDKTDRDSG